MLGFLLYLTTIGGVPHSMCIPLGLYALCVRRTTFRVLPRGVYQALGIYFLFILGATLNVAIHSFFTGYVEVPYVWLMPLIFIVAYALEIRDIKWFVVFALLEALVGLYEYSIGINTILPWVTSKEIGDSDFMYFNKVKGLSDGSATYAIKLLIALVFADRYEFVKHKYCYIVINFVLIFAIIMCFSRTVLIVTILFKLLLLAKTFYARFLFGNTNKKLLIILSGLLLFVVGIFCVSYIWDDFIFQLFRGSKNIDLSGRDDIWKYYIDFIQNNLLLGNNSCKFLNIDGNHGHNSYLQLIANNGILLTLLLFVGIFWQLKRRDYIYVLPFFVLSTAQYALFWGFSYVDVILAFFLFNRNCRLTLNRTINVS